ncbi:MAG: helicase-related protein, partial [Chitinophagaceae bacterium]
LSVFGISATIGNLQEAMDVLLYPLLPYQQKFYLIKGGNGIELYNNKRTHLTKAKQIKVETIIPNEVDKYPWAGHLGLKLAAEILPIINASTTTLIFINTRGMSERWYQTLLDIEPNLAGTIALHHGSIEKETREWIENALHQQKLKAVICTASLDLGVDFRPVDTVIQVGSPKGVSRFLQRAGRSGHAPGEVSKIYFLPTHSLEIVECIALQQAINLQVAESKPPLFLCFDVLMQFLCTLAVGNGFNYYETFALVQQTFCFNEITLNEWQEILMHLTQGGKAFEQYDEYKKLEKDGDNYVIKDRRQAFRHRLHIGTIVSDAMLKVKLQQGKYLGVIEEWFISKLNEGDSFIIGGRNVSLVHIKDMTVTVKPSTNKKALIPSWMGGRMSLSSNLGELLRNIFNQLKSSEIQYLPETIALQPLLNLQQQLSHIPSADEVLVEHFTSKDGYHMLVYLFEGRQIHEAISAIVAMRLSKIETNSFSIAMNDYGFELLSDKPIQIDDTMYKNLFTTHNLYEDIMQSVNSVEMAKRKFRDIAVIGGLIFQGMPGGGKKARHLQSSASLIFNVLNEFDNNNILLKQAYQEVLDIQMDEARLRQCLERVNNSKFVVKHPSQFTPLSFPIIADGLNRNNLSNEKLEERIKRMQQQLTKNT